MNLSHRHLLPRITSTLVKYNIKWTYAPDGIAAMKVLYPYLTWEFSPLVAMPPNYRGPWLLEIVPLSNRTLWMLGTAFLFPVMFYLQRWGA